MERDRGAREREREGKENSIKIKCALVFLAHKLRAVRVLRCP